MEQKYYTTTIDSDAAHYTVSPYWGTISCTSNTQGYEKEFGNRMNALAAAKKTAAKIKDDVIIYRIDSVVKFPMPTLEVEELV